MLNQIVLVGRISNDIEIKEVENKKVGVITLSIPRSWKNSEGEYDTDYIECLVYDNVAKNVKEYCKKGDCVGIRGRIQNLNGNSQTSVVAERISFLSSNN